MKSIFIVGSCYPAELGGPSNTIFRFAKSLSENGHDVEVFTTKKGLSIDSIMEYSIVNDRPVSIQGVKVTFFDFFLSNVFPLSMIKKVMFSKRNTVFHLNSIFYLPSIILMIIFFIKRQNYTLAPRGELFKEAFFNKKPKKLVYFYFFKKILSSHCRLIATSAAEMSLVNSRFPHNEVVILPNYMEIHSSSELFDSNYLLYLGRLHSHKCIENLIAAYIKLSCEVKKDIPLYIAGTGDGIYVDTLKKMSIGHNIKFLGHLRGSEKDKVLANASLMILPSKSENFGNVVLEALQFGTPVLACYNSPWELLPETGAGYFSKNDSISLADCISRYFSQSLRERKDMQLNAISTAKMFSIDEHFDCLVNTYYSF